MPIRDENKARYPKDWKAISRAVREEAGQKCEACGAPNGELIQRGVTDDGRAVWRMASDPYAINGRCAETGEEVPDTWFDEMDYRAPVRVVLTVAHLDHQPENCDRDNLRAWCQRCHNAYDAANRRKGIRERRRAECAVGNLL